MTDIAAGFTMVLPKEYPLVILGCLILCLECFLMGFCVVGPARARTFNKEFME